jgi:DNA-directed RNA polymerase specialized sigma24 family protein
MRSLKQVESQAADHYWLAFLLTGNREASLDAAVDAAELRADANPFFATWLLRWSRKIAISKALSAIREELRTSSGRVPDRLAKTRVSAPKNWSLSRDTTKLHLERALLAMDAFPRCVLVLSILERLPIEDVAILLDEDRELIQQVRAEGVHELVRNQNV